MKYGLVVILLAGICGLAVGRINTCAVFFNPFVNSFRSVQSCYPLVVEGLPVGIVTNKDVVKTQGPNKGETCVRFTFVVRNGLGIRRAKVGLWNREIPNTNVRFTRKRKFLDSEPTTVRVDACLDDIPAEDNCCREEQTTFLVAEAKVRMENGKVATATLFPTKFIGDSFPGAVTCGNDPQQIACGHGGDYENGDGFIQCELKVECDNIGGEPAFIGINRIDRAAGNIQVVLSPPVQGLLPESLQISVYEDPGASAINIAAEARTVIDRPASALETFGENLYTIATFVVPELVVLNAVAFALTIRTAIPREARYSVRAGVPGELALQQFLRFSSLPVFANTGPLTIGLIAEDSFFGPIPDNSVVGRIGSVICGFCLPADFSPRGEWRTLPIPQTQPLNSDQFDAQLARRRGVCIFEGEVFSIGRVCGPEGEQGVSRKIRWFLHEANVRVHR